MGDNLEFVTVFRSADSTAVDDAQELVEVLAGEGIEARVFDDSAPGVISGAVEVRVAAMEAARADRIIAAAPVEGDMADGDPSTVLDPVTVYRSAGMHSDVEAFAIEGMLKAAGIQPIRVGSAQYPSLPFEIRVAREHAERAKDLIASAPLEGAAAAEEEEAAG